MKSFPDVTVCLCTLDRAEGASEAFRSLFALDVARERAHLLIVDNGSREHDAHALGERLTGEAGAAGFSAHHVIEERRGLTHARNRALEEARGTWLAFIDDDELADPRWLGALLDAIDADDGAAGPLGCVGGPMRLRWPGDVPAWYSPPVGGYLSELDLGPDTHDVDPHRTPLFGGNFCVQREAVRALGGFDASLGRSGHESLLGNEERLMQLALVDAGHRIRYVADAIIFHHVMTDRHDDAWLRRRAHDQGVSDARLRRIVRSDGRTRRLLSASRDWLRRRRALAAERGAGRWTDAQATLLADTHRARFAGTVREILRPSGRG